MHSTTIEHWKHSHAFLGEGHDRHRRRTAFVVALTAVMMVAETVGGTIYGSMALVADGWHMATHAGALAIAAWAYHYARHHADDARYSFGTGKLGDLAGFASAIILGMIALGIGYESIQRLANPVPIYFSEAIAIAVIGLLVNLGSAAMLHDPGHHDGHARHAHHHHAHDHGDGHLHRRDHDHSHGTHHVDHNLRSAYVHVLADALTSVLAIAALLLARFYGWLWIDPLMGIVGAAVIAAWSWSLIRTSASVLLDTVPDHSLADMVRTRLESGGDRVSDLHLWRVGPGHLALIASVVSDAPRPPADYRARLSDVAGLSHVSIEVQPCAGHGAHS